MHGSRPRYVPSSVRLRVLFGGFFNQFGWLFFGFGLIFVWFFAFNADFSSLFLFRGPLKNLEGVINSIEKTGASEGGSRSSSGAPIYAYRYTFFLDEVEFSGVSYRTGKRFKVNQCVTIEYPVGNPSISRIENMRRAIFGPIVGFVIIFPLVGAVFIIVGVKNGLKANRLLTDGRLALGSLKSKETTNTRINKRMVYKLTFEFEAPNGQSYQAVAKTHLPETLEDEEREQLLYDPVQPDAAVMLNSLPGSPALDDSGNVYFKSAVGPALLVLFLPAVTIIGHGLFLWKKFVT
ncbi:MAG: DUF3592 domain-containing protein [bacterium]|nr:DUF3592 domain-containing protein [bacterium]